MNNDSIISFKSSFITLSVYRELWQLRLVRTAAKVLCQQLKIGNTYTNISASTTLTFEPFRVGIFSHKTDKGHLREDYTEAMFNPKHSSHLSEESTPNDLIDSDSVDPKAPVANPDNIDLSKLSPQELKIYKMYGKLPSKKDLFEHKLQERKYFDSGDYALRRAGIKSDDLQSSPIASNNLPLTNPSRLRESIIKRRMSNSASSASNVDANTLSRQGSISSGPPPRSPNK